MTAQDTFDALKYRIEVDEFGDRHYYNSVNQLHRTDGPAIEYANGNKEWWVDGKYHRIDGPAIEWPNGDKMWCVDGRLHREDGPAIERASGGKAWFVNAEALTEEEFNALVKK